MHARCTTTLAAFPILVALASAACIDHKSTPTAATPSAPTQTGVSGRWATDIAVQAITGRMTWMLTQSSSAVTGPVLVSLPTGTVLLNGSLNGTLAGTSMPYTISVAPGGIPSQPTCTGQLGGTMTVATGATTMVGPMAVISSNCSIQLAGNTITLTKQ